MNYAHGPCGSAVADIWPLGKGWQVALSGCLGPWDLVRTDW